MIGKTFSQKHLDSIGKPKFKSIYDKDDSFAFDTDKFPAMLDIPTKKLSLKLKNSSSLNFDIVMNNDDKILGEDNVEIGKLTINRPSTGKYFLSIAFSCTRVEPVNHKEKTELTTVGIDMGCKDFVILNKQIDGKFKLNMTDVTKIVM